MNSGLEILIKKARDLFNRYGIKSVTMDDLARELGMSKKTIYQMVKDKHELVNHIVEYELSKHDKTLNNILSQDLDAIQEMFEVNQMVHTNLQEYSLVAEFDLRKYYTDVHQRIWSFRRERMYDFISKNIQKGKNEGLFRKEINVDLITRLYIARLDSLCLDEYFIHFETPKSQYLLDVLEYHIRGMANAAGLEKLEEYSKHYKNKN